MYTKESLFKDIKENPNKLIGILCSWSERFSTQEGQFDPNWAVDFLPPCLKSRETWYLDLKVSTKEQRTKNEKKHFWREWLWTTHYKVIAIKQLFNCLSRKQLFVQEKIN